jgi:DNA replication protein DnaC
MKGKSVLFAHVPNLITELKETMSNNQLNSYRKRFEKYDLVILDELGYVSMDKAGCETLFNLISSRNDKGSIIVTSNLTFDRWEEVFKDPTLTGALIDRLAHRAHVLDISRDKGGRFEETIAWLEDSKR